MSRQGINKNLRPRSVMNATALILAAVLGSLPAAQTAAAAPHRNHRATVVKPAPAPSFPALDHDAEQYALKSQSLEKTEECVPMHVRDQGAVGILYLSCSDAAFQKDGEAVEISENFKAPQDIARRFNFWRRIYSLWGKDQYVMHLSQYPEVVIESYDASRVGDEIGEIRREIMVKGVAKRQRDEYSKLFMAMYRLRADETKFTPAMQRMAAAMAHIEDKDKYLIAARTLRLQRGQRDFIANGLAVAPRYLSAIETEFKAQGLPVEITRLAFVESSFNLGANSKVGASGVYQIMPATGRQYLKIVPGIDERRDPIKASRAAAKLLKLNFELTGSWPLAITAYNHGAGGIRRAVSATHSTDIVDLINRYNGPAFGFASKNFYSSFLAVLATLKERDKLFPEVPKIEAMAFEPVTLVKPTSIAAAKKTYNMTTAEIAELNPDLERSMLYGNGWLPRGYVLKVAMKAKTDAPKPVPPTT